MSASVNYIISHDGFTLYDTVAYVHTFELPVIPEGMSWCIAEYTGDESNKCAGNMCGGNVTLMPRSLMLLVGNKSGRI